MMQKTAPMGWNSWDCYGAAVDEATVRANAQFMAENLRQYGWEYIVVDIQWSAPDAKNHEYEPFAKLCMDEYGRLMPAPNRFPSAAEGKGFAPLAEYVHSLGLKFGIHIMRGIPRAAVHADLPIKGSDRTARQIVKTASICAWNTDMYGVDPEKEGAREYYESLIELYASWGVDFIKCDDIAREMPHEEAELVLISSVIHKCSLEKRKIIFSISPGPAPLEKAELFKRTANMWRITDDFWDRWELLYAMFERCEKWSIHTGAEHWPDADMLPIGPILQDYDKANRTKFTQDEQITMLTLWSIFRSPLMIGGEMTGFDDFTMSLLTNEHILRMHRNARHSHQVWRRMMWGREIILWTAASSEGGTYVAIFNAEGEGCNIALPLVELELEGKRAAIDLWSGERLEPSDYMVASLPEHGAAAFLFE